MTRCRDLLGQPPPEDAPPESAAVLLQRLTGVDLARCPICGEGRMHLTAMGGSPERMADVVKADTRRWGDVIRAAKVTLE